MTKIIDVSNNNRADLAAAKRAGAKGVYTKVSEGLSFVDSTYGAYRDSARQLGLATGGYHFGHPKNDPVEEAEHFVSLLRLRKGDLLPCLDLEVADGASPIAVRLWATKFLDHVEKRLGVRPALYSGEYFMKANSLTSLRCAKWVASYGRKPSIHFDAWQYSNGTSAFPGAICGLDTSSVPALGALQYKPTLVKKVPAKVRRARLRAWLLTKRASGATWASLKASAQWKTWRRLGGR